MLDGIMFWSEVCNECNRLDHTTGTNPAFNRGPTLSSRATAIVHIAMHDAFFSVAGFAGLPAGTPNPRLYLNAPPAYAGGTADADVASAISGAAAHTLKALYPGFSQLIDAKVAELITSRGYSAAGFAHGVAIGAAVLASRNGDMAANAPDSAHVASTAPDRHRVDPASPSQGYLGVGYGSTARFVVTPAPLDPVPNRADAIYQKDFKEVYEKGGAPLLNTTTRTPDQTAVGLYWGYDGAEKIGTPPRLYNQILAKIATTHATTEAENARLFGLANAAMGDCGIYAWKEKYLHDYARPVVGIREYDTKSVGPGLADADANKAVTPPCDPFWLPLGRPASNKVGEFSRTPNFPAYPSGHATFGAAVFETVRLFFKDRNPVKHKYTATENDNVGFVFVSDELNGKTVDPDGSVRVRHVRKFDSAAEAMLENSVSRVYLGVHWRFDGTSAHSIKNMLSGSDRVGGVPLGRDIATLIHANFKQP
jgi:Vanadium chloroperoxidase N-terminal domain/PAP2 superfamily